MTNRASMASSEGAHVSHPDGEDDGYLCEHAAMGWSSFINAYFTDPSTMASRWEQLYGLQDWVLKEISAVQHGDLQLSSAADDELWIRHEDQLILDLRLERLLVQAATLLERAQIPYRALKGPVKLEHLLAGDESWSLD